MGPRAHWAAGIMQASVGTDPLGLAASVACNFHQACLPEIQFKKLNFPIIIFNTYFWLFKTQRKLYVISMSFSYLQRSKNNPFSPVAEMKRAKGPAQQPRCLLLDDGGRRYPFARTNASRRSWQLGSKEPTAHTWGLLFYSTQTHSHFTSLKI